MVAVPDPVGRVRYQGLRSRIPAGDAGSLIGVGAEVGVAVGTGVGVREGATVDGGDGVGTLVVVGAGRLVVVGAGTLVGGRVDGVAAAKAATQPRESTGVVHWKVAACAPPVALRTSSLTMVPVLPLT